MPVHRKHIMDTRLTEARRQEAERLAPLRIVKATADRAEQDANGSVLKAKGGRRQTVANEVAEWLALPRS